MDKLCVSALRDSPQWAPFSCTEMHGIDMDCAEKSHLPIYWVSCIHCSFQPQPMHCISWLLRFNTPLLYVTLHKVIICMASEHGRITSALPLFHVTPAKWIFVHKWHWHPLWRERPRASFTHLGHSLPIPYRAFETGPRLLLQDIRMQSVQCTSRSSCHNL